MKIEIHSSFVKATKKLPVNIQQKVAKIIVQIQNAKTTMEISNCKKLTGYKTAFRIELETYRIGFFMKMG